MKRMMHIIGMTVMLLAALPVISCHHLEEDPPELSVSIYIPGIVATKGETGSVGALDEEKVFSSLQLWVFVSGGANDGQLVGYKGFTSGQLVNTGLPHSTVTRFAMPLSPDMFNILSQPSARVDVYALANAASVTDVVLGEGTTRNDLDAIVISGSFFGVSPSLTMGVPSAGLPMSGMLKGAPVTGGYPVLNVSTVNLTRAVSKIRFVFCQQGVPASGTDPAVPSNASCVVKSISFGGESAIAKSERLFTDNKYGTTDNLFDIINNEYTSLTDITLTGDGNTDLMSNGDISVCEHPEELLFRSSGHKTESAQEYESRLDATIGTSSQIGPIYIRETDKLISGTIVYNAGEGDKPVTFSMPATNVLTRNHSWILYAYFAEETKTLQLKIVVLPWDMRSFDYGVSTYNTGTNTSNVTVNVVRRFTITETDPLTFTKTKTPDGYCDIKFWHTLNDQPNVISGNIIIAAPVGQKLHIVAVPGALGEKEPINGLFTITPPPDNPQCIIYPNYGDPESATTEDCKIVYEISCNPGEHSDEELEGNFIDLHFCVEIGNNERWIDLDSESIDHYRIILKKNWNQ